MHCWFIRWLRGRILFVSFFKAVGWTVAQTLMTIGSSSAEAPVLVGLYLVQTDHRIDRRLLPMDSWFIRRYCLLLLHFFYLSDACRNLTVGSSDGAVGVLDRQPTKGSTRSRWMWLAEIGDSKEETRGTQFRQVRAARCVIPYVLYAA
jgi:hypothetical protein